MVLTVNNCYLPTQLPKLEDHPLSAAATTYSIHSQLPSICAGRHLHPCTREYIQGKPQWHFYRTNL